MSEHLRPGSPRTRKEYERRINAALDHIDRALGEDISLGKLATLACFSPFHFHRIFSAFVGEPPAEYVRRLRLEKAAILLASGEWLPGSGWQPDDAPAFESYIGEPTGAPARPHFVFDLYVPVKPL